MEVDLETQLDAMAQLEALKKEKDIMLASRCSNLPAGVQVYRLEHESMKILIT